MKNLASGPQASSQLSALREQMHAELRTQGDPRMDGKGAIFDEYKHSNPSHVGFHERFMAGEKLKAGWVSPSDFEPAPLPTK